MQAVEFINRSREGRGYWTTEDSRSKYNQPVWQWDGEIAVGDRVSYKTEHCGDTPIDNDVHQGLVLWTDGAWAVLDMSGWDMPLTALHLDSGFGASIKIDGYTVEDRRHLTDDNHRPTDDQAIQLTAEIISAKRLTVDDTIADWTGQTIGLLPPVLF